MDDDQAHLAIERVSPDPPFFGCDPEDLDALPSIEEMVRNLTRAGHPSSISNRVLRAQGTDVDYRYVEIRIDNHGRRCLLGYAFSLRDPPDHVERVSRAMMLHILATQFPGALTDGAAEEV